MNRFIAAFVAAPLFLLSLTAHAETDPPQTADDAKRSPDTTHAAEASTPSFARLRFDAETGVLVASAQSRRVSAESASPAMRLDLGVQLGDHAAIFARVEGGTILATFAGAAYLAAEWTPVRALSLGTGIGYDAVSIDGILVCGGAAHCPLNEWWGVSVPAFVAVNIGSDHRADGSRLKLRIELEGAGGYDRQTDTFGVHGMIALGGAWM